MPGIGEGGEAAAIPARSGGSVTRLFRLLDRAVELVVAVLFVAIVLAGALQIFNRFVLNESLSWSEEFQKFGHIWIVFLAIPIAHRRGMHIHMDIIRRRLPRRASFIFDVAIELLWLAFGAALMILSYQVSVVAARQISPGLEVPMSWPYYGMVTGGMYLLIVAARRLGGLVTRSSAQAEP
jgi:TRAP-type C4-dicarboxylate transport system permease small subunit